MGMGFTQQYYTLYHQNRAALSGVYHPTKSQYTFEGKKALVGQAEIAANLPSLPNGTHAMSTIDAITAVEAAAPVNGLGPAVLTLITGKITLENEANFLPFAHAFFLAVEGGAPFCANDAFLFNYG